jgi:hypothetical protein
MSKKNSSKSQKIVSRLKGLASVTETFNRTDGLLGFGGGTSSVPWQTVRGSWSIAANKAVGNPTVAYPIAALQFTNTDVTLSVDGIAPGVGTAFWVTDSNNWWGSYLDNTQTCSTCANSNNIATYVTNSTFVPAVPSNCTTYSSPLCSFYNQGNFAGTYYAYGCGADSCQYPYQTPISNNSSEGLKRCGCGSSRCCRAMVELYNQGTCGAFYNNCTAYNASQAAFTFNTSNPSTYNAITYFSCNCVNNYSVKIVKNIAGTITQVTSFALSALAVGFRTILSGSTITVRAFAGAGYTSQIGADQNVSSTGAVKTKQHGIMRAAVNYAPSQTNVIDSFSV